ncbi:MAG: nitroreductase family protein [Bacteroidales bacterium]|nr:nitroreductase family protein [Bacteroidales bacterium]
MTIKEIVYKNRSYRRFYEEVEISRQQLTGLVDLARMTPSPKNLQALKFKIVNDRVLNEKVFPTLAWAGYLKDWKGPEKGERPAAYLFILADKKISPDIAKDYLYTASGYVAQSMLLGAVEMGFGGCTIAAFKKNELIEAINLPEHLEIMLVLALGKPKESIVIKDVDKEGDIRYYRDNKGNHFVPKRTLNDLIIE